MKNELMRLTHKICEERVDGLICINVVVQVLANECHGMKCLDSPWMGCDR